MRSTGRLRGSAGAPASTTLLSCTSHTPSTRRARNEIGAPRRAASLGNARAMAMLMMFDDPGNLSADLIADAYEGQGWPADELREELTKIELEGGEVVTDDLIVDLSAMIEMAKHSSFDVLVRFAATRFCTAAPPT